MLNLLNSARANKISNRKSCQPARFEQENGVPVLLSLHCESNPLKDLEKHRVKAMEINNQLEIFISPPCQPLQYFVVKLHTSASRHFPLLHWNCQWLDSPWEPKGTWGIQGWFWLRWSPRWGFPEPFGPWSNLETTENIFKQVLSSNITNQMWAMFKTLLWFKDCLIRCIVLEFLVCG